MKSLKVPVDRRVQVLGLQPDIVHHSMPIVPWSNQPVGQWLGVEVLDSRPAVQQTAPVEQALVEQVARMEAFPKVHNLATELYPMLCLMVFRPNLGENAE